MSKEKEFVGTVCGHHHNITLDGDCHCVEFSDAIGDVCTSCFSDVPHIHEEDSPYDGDYTDYWFDGSVEDFKKLIVA
jgi:hypothetical protein